MPTTAKGKALGDVPAFPRPAGSSPGMTYRQWLVGQVLGKAQGVIGGNPTNGARVAIECIDAVLNELAEQETPGA